MSTAQLVPETWELTGDDAFETLTRTGRWCLLRDAFKRLRSADGFSHARSLAFMTSLVLVQGMLAIVGLAAALGKGAVSDLVVRTVKGAVPGPAGDLLTQAAMQAQRNGSSGRYIALVAGVVTGLFTATTAMGQLERGLNRIYGVEQDRPTVAKYRHAFLLALGAGGAFAAGFVALAYGRAVGEGLDNGTVSKLWSAVRWPLGVALVAVGVTLLLRWSPRRRQPAMSWLAFGATIAVLVWVVVTLALALFFHLSSGFGQTYGPLAGMIGLLLWALLTSMAVLFGAAVAAQLEAVRAGAPAPQDVKKVVRSEPSASPAAASA